MCKHAFIFSLKLFGVEFLSLAIKILTQLPVSIPFFHSKKRNLTSSQTEALGIAGPSSAPMMLPLLAGPSLSSCSTFLPVFSSILSRLQMLCSLWNVRSHLPEAAVLKLFGSWNPYTPGSQVSKELCVSHTCQYSLCYR